MPFDRIAVFSPARRNVASTSGTSGNGSSAQASGPVVVGGAEAVAYIVDRAAATGEAYLPEQVYGVLETQLAYLRSIGAVGPPADEDRDAP